MIRYGDTTYTYTSSGELSTRTNPSESSETGAYAYDALGNLRSVTQAGGKTINYLIDGRNRRVGKQRDGTLVQALLYEDGLRPVAEFDSAENTVSRFVYATSSGAPAYMTRGAKTYRIIPDEIGSPRLVVDTQTGLVVQRMDYDSFGNVTSDSNPGFQPFGFAGGLYDPDTDFVRFGSRDYDPSVGRWTARTLSASPAQILISMSTGEGIPSTRSTRQVPTGRR